jgi:hypothetical protein
MEELSCHKATTSEHLRDYAVGNHGSLLFQLLAHLRKKFGDLDWIPGSLHGDFFQNMEELVGRKTLSH